MRAVVGLAVVFAIGHGCSIGGHPDDFAIRERAADLRARIAARKTTAAGARRGTARAVKPTAAPSEQRPPAAPTAENGNGSATAEE